MLSLKIKVFICYASEDYEKAKLLYESLKNYPMIAPWIDRENLLPGTEWENAIFNALEESHFFILLLSNNSIGKKGFVQKEIKEALDKLKYYPPGRVFLIPARLDQCEPLYRELKKIQWAELFVNWDEGVNRIVASILHNVESTYSNLDGLVPYNEAGIKACVVDDDYTSRILMSDFLEDEGFRTVQFRDPDKLSESGTTLYQELEKERTKLIIMDVRFGRNREDLRKGIKTIEDLANRKILKSACLVIMVSQFGRDLVEFCSLEKVLRKNSIKFEFLEKPIDFIKLNFLLKKII